MEVSEANAKVKLQEHDRVDTGRYNRITHIISEPIVIGSTEDIGTARVRANHPDGIIHFFMEQEKLKARGAPIEPCEHKL